MDCVADEDWRRTERGWADKLMNTYYASMQTAGKIPDAKVLASLTRLRSQVDSADDDKKCASAHRALVQWQYDNLR